MNDINELLFISKNIAESAFQELVKIDISNIEEPQYSEKFPREMKTSVDNFLEKIILEKLLPTGISILSEESGEINNGVEGSSMRFIIDPLDGTVNFIRKLAPCSISIALFNKMQPIFGVLMIYPTGELAWGGKEIGSFMGNNPISVSNFSDCSQSILCTGFPSRFDFENKKKTNKHSIMLNKFGKVRMLGSASNSLLQVAKGSAEAYFEQEIMLWDVAAGLALVEGAGGQIKITDGSSLHARNITATNGYIKI